MARRWLTGLNTATVQHHNHESFIFTNSTASMWLYKRTVGVCQHTLSESISRCYCFFPPHTTTAFSIGMIAAQARGTDIFVSVVSLGFDSQCLCMGCLRMCDCVYEGDMHSVRFTAWDCGRKTAQIYLWMRRGTSAYGGFGRPCLFVLLGSHGCTDQEYLPVRLCQMKTCRAGKNTNNNKKNQTNICVYSLLGKNASDENKAWKPEPSQHSGQGKSGVK